MAEQKLEDRIFFHSFAFVMRDSDAIKVLKAEEGIIKEAYFGRWPKTRFPGLSVPIGLNLIIDFSNDRNSITYTDMVTISLLMGAFGVERPEYLNGRYVTAYMKQDNIEGISIDNKRRQ